MIDVCPIFTTPESWYRDLVHYFQQGNLREHWNSKKRRALCLKSASYQIINGIFFRKNYDGVFLRCLKKEYDSKVVKELHDFPMGGHFYGDTTTHKILRASYYWTMLFKYSHTYARKYDVCQRHGG